MLAFCLLLFFAVFSLGASSSLILENTLDKNQSYKDCFISPNVVKESDDRLSFCLRLDHQPITSQQDICHTGNLVTFEQLQEIGVNATDLVLWQVPLDIADLYGAFLTGMILDHRIQYICNCSSSTTFGRYCEYSFEEGIDTVEDLLKSSINGKTTLYPEERLLPCYELTNNMERCLDYRDICDGEWDTETGEDEFHCERIETNTCADHEFRCRNGLCIDRQFLFDGQADCPDLSDEQRNLLYDKYGDFRHCYQQATFDCDERWCGREWLSCGDGECVAWNRRFWNGFDCSNYYTHVYNCELEERDGKSIEFSLTDHNGRCKKNIMELNIKTDANCSIMITCAMTLHPTCAILGMHYNTYQEAIHQIHILCENRSQIVYASGAYFLSPFIRAYYTLRQFQTINNDFFSIMKVRQPGQLCFTGEYICQGVTVVHNGTICFDYDEIFEKNYPFSPYEFLFCRSTLPSSNFCTNTSFFYHCRTSGECISKHRLFDGFPDCIDLSDEQDLEAFRSLPSSFMKDRYYCNIDGVSLTAVMRHFLGDGASQCPNGTDEMSLSVNWQQIKCLESEDLACSLLRDLFNTNDEKQSTFILPFTSLCDSIWDLRNGSDETECEEWVCEQGWIKQHTNLNRWSGNCINPAWRCNNVWDYADGSDELNCNRTDKYPTPNCLLLGTATQILLNETNLVAGNGKVECSGGIDERVTFACADGFPLNDRFLCDNQAKCLAPKYLCDQIHDCSKGEDESDFWCGPRSSSITNTCAVRTFACQERNDSGPCVPHDNRCNGGDIDCKMSYRDEFLCVTPRHHMHINSQSFTLPILQRTVLITSVSPWYCDRGLVVYRYGQPTCLCPPSFFGQRCEKHSHRLTVVFTLKIDMMKADVLRISVLLLNGNQSLDHILVTQHSSFTGKHRLYLNYPRSLYSDVRQLSNNYRVQFRLYAVNSSLVRLLSIKQYPVKFSFLPAFRLAVVLDYEENSIIHTDHEQNELKSNSPCASGSHWLQLVGQDIACICTSQHYGPTCHLKTKLCQVNFCRNQGTCISYTNDIHIDEYHCSCPQNHFGKQCEYTKASLSLDFRNETIESSSTRIIQLINYDSTKMQFNIERQHLMLQTVESLFYDDFQLPPIGLLKVHETHHTDVYLLYLGHNYSKLDVIVWNKVRCAHVKEFSLIPKDYSSEALLSVMKRYHRPCQMVKNTSTICFYDPRIYFCFCNATTKRSVCFFYDFEHDRCDNCLNGGRCYVGEQKIRRKDFICRCEPCMYGALCEFRMDRLSFSFESLLMLDLNSRSTEFNQTIQSHRTYSIWIYVSISAVMATVGLVSNIFTHLKVIPNKSTRSVIPRYIRLTALSSQMTLICLLLQIIYITLNQYQVLSESLVNRILCKSLSYILNCFAYTSKCYATLLSVNRAWHVRQLRIIPMYSRKQLLWPVAIFLIILIFNGTEVIFHRLINDPRKLKHLVCTVEYTEPIWRIVEMVFRFLIHIFPFILNLYAVIIIIRTVAKSKRNIHRSSFVSEFWKQVKQYHEQLLCPVLMIICSTPQLLMTVIVKCYEWNNAYYRTLMIVAHFVSFIPQVFTYYLFVQLSKTYKKSSANTQTGQIPSTVTRPS